MASLAQEEPRDNGPLIQVPRPLVRMVWLSAIAWHLSGSEHKVLHRLLETWGYDPDPENLTTDGIAKWLGLERKTVAKTIKKLAMSGYVFPIPRQEHKKRLLWLYVPALYVTKANPPKGDLSEAVKSLKTPWSNRQKRPKESDAPYKELQEDPTGGSPRGRTREGKISERQKEFLEVLLGERGQSFESAWAGAYGVNGPAPASIEEMTTGQAGQLIDWLKAQRRARHGRGSGGGDSERKTGKRPADSIAGQETMKRALERFRGGGRP